MFRIFTPLFAQFDKIVLSFANTVSSRVMVEITPVITAALLLWVLWWSVLIMSGRGHAPIAEFFRRYLRNAVIVSIALGAGYYQSTVAALVESVPDELAATVMGPEAANFNTMGGRPFLDPMSTGGMQGAVIDRAAGQGLAQAHDILAKAGFFTEQGIVFATLGVLLLLATVAFVALGAAFIITAKLVLGILVGVGPLFIAALLFESTRQFFARWMHMIVTYGLIIVLFSALFTFMLGIFEHYVSQVNLSGGMNATYAIAGALILSVVSILVLREMKPLAMGLAGGLTLGPMAWMSSWRGGGRAPPPPPPPPPSGGGGGGGGGGGNTSGGGGGNPPRSTT